MKTLFNNNWNFAKAPVGTTVEAAEKPGFSPVDIPHDWLIHNAKNLYESSFGFYKKAYDYSNNKTVRLYFEGVYQDCTIYVNGKEAGENKYGYSSFEVNITDFLNDGENEIIVLVRHEAPNSRWYSGAGIFRNVWIYETDSDYLVADGTYFSAKKQDDIWKCNLSAEKSGEGTIEFTITDKNGNVLYNGTGGEFEINHSPEIIWDIHTPNLLNLCTRLIKNEKAVDESKEKIGLREIEYKADSGFYLNNRHVKLHGVCLHHDLGALGSAFNKEAARRQLMSMKEMGVNAVRTSHNMPAKGFMELCDETGMLVDSEAFDMWERSKTEFDYARFFDDRYEKDVASWIRRDRNHPSVIMWSVGNEIYDTHVSPRGCEVSEMLHKAVRKHDPLCNAPTTIGSNYMPWDNAQLCAEKVDLVGYNYGENCYQLHHDKYPHWKIYGSETTAGVKSRGVYHLPLGTAFLTHDDLQCSSLGNCRAGETAPTAEDIILKDLETDYCAGMFIWTGSDYIGEPSPYSTKNSYYGSIDTAGLKKDSFYLYQSAWSDKKILHLLPYWDFNEGQLVDIVAFTNLREVELFLNGKSLGRSIPDKYICKWQAAYETGEIKAIGYDENGAVYEDSRHSFANSKKIVLEAEKSFLYADGEDLTAVVISTVDENGYPVENARDRISIEVEGARLVGFDNGDSTDYDDYKSASRKLFSGKATALIASSDKSGTAVVRAKAQGLVGTEIAIEVKPSHIEKGVSFIESIPVSCENNEIPVRKISLKRNGGNVITPENNNIKLTAEIMPPNAAFNELCWSVVTNSGIAAGLAKLEAVGNEATLTAVGDGEFRVRCSCNNGKPQPEIISDFEFKAEGFGQPFTNPYSFVTGCFYNVSKGLMDEVSEGGISMTREQNLVGYTKLDFGKYGTDEVTVRIIHWHTNEPVDIKIWDGNPSDGGRLLGVFSYQADFIWQTYQDNTFSLPEKLTGHHDIYFEYGEHEQRIYFGGFFFIQKEKAYQRIKAIDNALLHGDTYKANGDRIEGIGNNVFIDFDDMNFTKGISSLRITGRTRHDNDSVHIYVAGENGEVRDIVEFPYSDDYITVEKQYPDYRGMGTVKLCFLPGCDFDLEAIEFVPEK